MRIFALIFALAAGAAFAQTAQKPNPAPAKPAPAAAGQSAAGGASAATGSTASLFSRLDRNRDGYLDKNELASDLARRGNWVAMDRDGDGRISRSEFRVVESR
jgi:hypothetical protein